MTLPANSTFLPILDDLLSPDLRPVLQTPTADFCGTPISGTNKLFVIGANNGVTASTNNQSANKGIHANANGRKRDPIPEECEQEASIKIQNWWRTRNVGGKPQRRNSAGQVLDVRAERAKHSIRHHRTEEHIHQLETEVGRLKSALLAERKLRSLQLDAIKSLWGQVQKITTSSDPNQSIMTQSMPNGLLASPPKKETQRSSGMSMSFSGGTLPTLDEQTTTTQPETISSADKCDGKCSKEIQLLRESLTGEISQLRDMITRLTMNTSGSGTETNFKLQAANKSDVDSDISVLSPASAETEEKSYKEKDHHPQRPLSLNIIGKSQGQVQVEQPSNQNQPEKQEITGYASEMANKLLEDAAVKKEDEPKISTTKPMNEESHF